MYASTPDRPAAVHAQAFPGARHLSIRRRRRVRALRVALLAALLTATLMAGLGPLHDTATPAYVAGAGGTR